MFANIIRFRVNWSSSLEAELKLSLAHASALRATSYSNLDRKCYHESLSRRRGLRCHQSYVGILAQGQSNGTVMEFNIPTEEEPYPDPPNTTTFGAEGRISYVQKIITCKLDSGKEYVCIADSFDISLTSQITVARKGGVVQMYDLNSLQLEREWKGHCKEVNDPIIGLEFLNDHLYTCSAMGRVIVRDLLDEDSEFSYWYTKIREPVSAFRIHPNQPDIVASGGKDKDLEVVQLMSPQASDSRLGMVRANWFMQMIHNEDVGHQRLRTKWQAKRNPNEFEFRPQVWVSDIQFLDTSRPTHLGWRLAASTRYGEINIYETASSKRPVLSVMVSDYPLVNLWFGGNERELLYTNTQNGVGVFDSVTGKVVKMKGEAGTSMLHVSAAYKDGKPEFPEIQGPRIGASSQSILYPEEENSMDSSTQTDSQNSTATQEISASRTASPVSVSMPSVTAGPIMVSGGLDTYLRVYDLQAAQMVSKINTNAKISDVWIIDAGPMPRPEENIRSSLRRRRESITEPDDGETIPSENGPENKRQRYDSPEPNAATSFNEHGMA